jgi:hypothetical protein
MMIFDTKKHFLCRLNEVNIAPIDANSVWIHD